MSCFPKHGWTIMNGSEPSTNAAGLARIGDPEVVWKQVGPYKFEASGDKDGQPHLGQAAYATAELCLDKPAAMPGFALLEP